MKSLFLTFALLAISACSTFDPVKHAETLEQKGYAAYGTFVIYEEQGAKLIADPAVSDNIKSSIQRADAVAKPAADAARDATLEVSRVKKAFEAAETTEDTLVLVTETLDQEIKTFKPLLDRLIDAVD